MNVFYISNFPLDGFLSPSVNEMGFVASLNKNFMDKCFYFIRGSADAVDLPKNRVCFFQNIALSRPLSFIFHSIYWAIKASWLAHINRSDIIIIRPERSPFKEILLTYFTSKKVVLKSSSKYWMDPPHLNTLDSIFKKIDLFLYDFLHKRVDGIECVTQEYKDFHLKNGIGGKKLCVIGNAISTDVFFYYPKEREERSFPVLGYCGAKPLERGAKQIVHLVCHLRERFPNIKGVIVGDDDNLDEIKKEVRSLGVEKYIDWVGRVPFKDVPNYISKFDVGFSFTAASDIVGGDSSMKLRQYLGMGIPVITFPMSNQFIEDNQLGYLVESDDYERLLTCAISLIDDIRKKGVKWKIQISKWAHDNFSYDILFQQRLAFWQSILNEK